MNSVKKVKIRRYLTAVIAILLSVFFLAIGKFGIFTYLFGAQKLPQGAYLDAYKDKYVTYEVKYPLEAYMQLAVLNEKDPQRYAYVTWDPAYDSFLCIHISEYKNSYMEQSMEQAWKYLTGNTDEEPAGGICVKGTVMQMSDEELTGYQNCIAQIFGTESGDEALAVYYIDDEQIHGQSLWTMFFCSGCALICLLAGTVLLAIGLMGAALDRREQQYQKDVDALLSRAQEETAFDMQDDE